jgi:hypothetical protein
MGWWFKQGATKKELVDEYIHNKNVIDHALVGNNLWMLVQSGENRVVCLALLRSERGYGYGSKDIDETMGPGDVNCPERLINNATEPLNDYSKKWRGYVREHHQKRRSIPKWKAGDRIKWWDGSTFTLSHKRGRGWITTCRSSVTTKALNRSGKLMETV